MLPDRPNVIYKSVDDVEEALALNIEGMDHTIYFLEERDSGLLYKKQYTDGVIKTTMYKQVDIPKPIKVGFAIP